MHFLAFCYRNVLRRKQRSTLTACSVAIAVAAVVALVGVATGFKRDFIQFYEGVGIDILAVGKGKILARPLDESLTDKIKAVEGVAEVVPGLTDQTSFPDYDLMIVPLNGIEPGTTVFAHMEILSGRTLTSEDGKAVMLGKTVAETLEKTAGDTVDIDGEDFQVVGVYDGFSVIEKGTIVMAIDQLQEHMDREGEVSGFSIIAMNGTTAEGLQQIIADIEAIDPSRIDAQLAREAVENQPGVKMGIGMAWVTSSIAMVIGTLGMLNTMLMSLQERVGEIGLLRAVGWTRSRIAKMILGESVLLSLLGGLVGVLAAFGLVEMLTWLPSAKGFISGQIDATVVAQGMAIAVGVGIVGGLLPALNATRLAPAEALRQ
ncbi:MAG: ABC transporter permease [Planctomycetota bacterium]